MPLSKALNLELLSLPSNKVEIHTWISSYFDSSGLMPCLLLGATLRAQSHVFPSSESAIILRQLCLWLLCSLGWLYLCKQSVSRRLKPKMWGMKLVWEWMEIIEKEVACKAALFGTDRRGNERVRLRGGLAERGCGGRREGDKEYAEQMVAGSQLRSKSSPKTSKEITGAQ